MYIIYRVIRNISRMKSTTTSIVHGTEGIKYERKYRPKKKYKYFPKEDLRAFRRANKQQRPARKG